MLEIAATAKCALAMSRLAVLFLIVGAHAPAARSAERRRRINPRRGAADGGQLGCTTVAVRHHWGPAERLAKFVRQVDDPAVDPERALRRVHHPADQMWM